MAWTRSEDPQIRHLISYLRNQGKTVFLNSHILQEVELVCDRVAILAKGQLRGVGTPAELTSQFHGGTIHESPHGVVRNRG